MASLKKPTSCSQCGGLDFKKITVTHTAPHYEGWICLDCIREPDNAIYPGAFTVFRPKRANGICRDCGRTPEQVEFKKGKNWCAECSSRYMARNYRDNIVDRKAYHSRPDVKVRRNASVRKANTRSPEGWLRQQMSHIVKPGMRNKVKKGHSDATLIIEIDYDFLIDLYYKQGGKCALTKLPMTHKRRDLYSISIDRIDSSLGYIPGNVQLVCKFINLGKSRHSNPEVSGLLDAYFQVRLRAIGDAKVDEMNELATREYSLSGRKKAHEDFRANFKVGDELGYVPWSNSPVAIKGFRIGDMSCMTGTQWEYEFDSVWSHEVNFVVLCKSDELIQNQADAQPEMVVVIDSNSVVTASRELKASM